MNDGSMPTGRRAWEDVRADMETIRAGDRPWYDSRMFVGGSYYAGEDVRSVADEAYRMYMNYNGMYAATAFPSLIRYEEDVVSWLLQLHSAPAPACGGITTGGTESLIMAVKTAGERARHLRPRVTAPEVVIPNAAHPVLDKAAHMMGMKAVRVERSVDGRADVEAMAAAINDSTIMINASAPSYPLGCVDPVGEIGALALAHDLWFHVDACHGGFVLPFARKLGYDVPAYDFAVAGVTSISIDVHKLGYANKGVSALLVRDAALEEYQRFTFDAWPSGLYSTLNLLGSRSGGGLASAWAVINYLGDLADSVADARAGKIQSTGQQAVYSR